MPQNITDVDAFTDPLTAPAGGDAMNSASVLSALQKIANRTRWLVNRVGGAAGSGEFLYASAKTRTVIIPLNAALIPNQGAGEVWQLRYNSVTGGDALELFCTTGGSGVQPPVYLDLQPHLPNGATNVSVEVVLVPNAAETGTDRMRVRVESEQVAFSPSYGRTIAHGTEVDDGGATAATKVTATIGGTIDKATKSYRVRILKANNSGDDIVIGARVTFTDAGPRND